MLQSFNEIKNRIEKNADNTNAGFFDHLLLEGGHVQSIFEEVKEKGYSRTGWFISDRTFWGHIGVRIKNNSFIVLVNENDILALSASKKDLDLLFNDNVFIKLIGCGDDIEVDDFYIYIKKSISDSAQERKRRLDLAPKKPNKIKTESSSFARNPDVIAEVLIRANGICESCNKPAPFTRKSDNTPYLEVHHIIFLANDGDDTVKNAIALCPNCHRQKHFGY